MIQQGGAMGMSKPGAPSMPQQGAPIPCLGKPDAERLSHTAGHKAKLDALLGGEDDEELLALEAEFKHKCFYDRDDTKQGASRKIMRIGWDPNSDNGSGGTGQWIAHTEMCDKLGKMCKQKRPEPYGLTVEGWADNMRDMITEFETRKKRMRKPK